MQVYEFEKCLLSRLRESAEVLQEGKTPIHASDVRSEWSYHVEMKIEPAGWQALWRIPRVACEEMQIKFPTVVYGNVEQVQFRELTALFRVLAVQDDELQIAEQHEVALEELFVCKSQENDAINVQITADCIDGLRFFFAHIWMPWDNDDDEPDWAGKHLESRIRFYYDLVNRKMRRGLADHIRMLIGEAMDIQRRRQYIALDMSEDDGEPDEDSVTELQRQNLKLKMIKNELEIFEDPEMRKVYENLKYPEEETVNIKPGLSEKVVVTKELVLEKHIEYLEKLRTKLRDGLVKLSPSLQQALDSGNRSDSIYLPPGRHSIKILEALNSQGALSGLGSESEEHTTFNHQSEGTATTVVSKCEESVLFTFDGDYKLENLVLDCTTVRTGLLVRRGNVTLRNCIFRGAGTSSPRQGIVLLGGSSVTLENCVLTNFSNAICCNDKTVVLMKESIIKDCDFGVDFTDGCSIQLENSNFMGMANYGFVHETKRMAPEDEKKIVYNCLDDLKEVAELSIQGDCKFEGNKLGNLVIWNRNFVYIPSNVSELMDVETIIPSRTSGRRSKATSQT